MSAYFRSYSRYDESRIGSVEDVLVCERASDGINLVGHNKSYEQILVPFKDDSLLGKRIKVFYSCGVIRANVFEEFCLLNSGC